MPASWKRYFFPKRTKGLQERSRSVWQAKSFELKPDERNPFGGATDCASVQKQWHQFVEHWQPENRGRLRARAHASIDNAFADPSTIAPTSLYRGPQNQLYRVEIHHAGAVGEQEGPTFKWSRENGSVSFPIVSTADPVLTISNLGRDVRSGLQVGDWVEIVDDDHILQHGAEPLRQVDKIDSGRRQVTLKGQAISPVSIHPDKHPLLRRWDHKQGDPRRGGLELRDGAALVREGEGDKSWLTLENGVQIQFRATEPLHKYRRGDYWLIPARTGTANVEWPHRGGEPVDLPPHGIEHYYAPLAIVAFNLQNVLEKQADCRPKFKIPKEY